MILSEYEAKRAELDQKMKEIGEREAEHKMELSIKYQAECKKIQSQIGNLKKRQKEALKQYQNDKMWFHRKYRDEKHEITQKMHMLKMEYLTVNGIKEGGMSFVNASPKAVELVNQLCDPGNLEEQIVVLEAAEDQLQEMAFEEEDGVKSHILYDVAFQLKSLKKSFVELKKELEYEERREEERNDR